MTLVRVPVVKVSFNAHCYYEYTFVLVTEVNALSLRKAEEETKKIQLKAAYQLQKEGKIQQGTNN